MKTIEMLVRVNLSVPDEISDAEIGELYLDIPIDIIQVINLQGQEISGIKVNEYETMNVVKV